MTLVALLTLRLDELEQFRTYERHAARVMATHGGKIERTVVVTKGLPPGQLKEIHLLSFPDAQAFAAYRADPALETHAHLRAQSVLHTELLVGEDGPDYASQ